MELSAARRGLGLIIARELIIKDDLASGTLIEIPVQGLPDTSYYAAFPTGQYRTSVVKFVAWLKTIF